MELVSALIGAVVGGLVTLVGQAYFGPKFERRVRSQERWEEHVLEAGRLISLDIPRLRDRVRGHHRSWAAFVQSSTGEADEHRKASLLALSDTERREAQPVYDQWEALLEERLRWLAARIRPRPEDRWYKFEREVELYGSYLRTLQPFLWEYLAKGEPTDEDPYPDSPEWGKEKVIYHRMADEIERLASSIVPFPLSWGGRIRKNYRDLRLRREKKRETQRIDAAATR